jgi:hypothetical protein
MRRPPPASRTAFPGCLTDCSACRTLATKPRTHCASPLSACLQAETTEEKFTEKAAAAYVDEDEPRNAVRDAAYEKGQSRRIWGELYKVVDSSDVIIQVGGCCWRVLAGVGGCWGRGRLIMWQAHVAVVATRMRLQVLRHLSELFHLPTTPHNPTLPPPRRCWMPGTPTAPAAATWSST